jgi:hypothetical protein
MFFGFLFIAISLYLISWVCLPSLYSTRRLFVVVAAARTNHDERLLCNLLPSLLRRILFAPLLIVQGDGQPNFAVGSRYAAATARGSGPFRFRHPLIGDL